MTHYKDINNIVYVDQRYICVGMYDGKLRVYRYPYIGDDGMEKYVEIKLWAGNFRVVSIEKIKK